MNILFLLLIKTFYKIIVEYHLLDMYYLKLYKTKS